jgi:uncharacterized protein
MPMFKTMRRFKQQLSQEKCIEILTNEPHGVLSLISDTGYPYGFPITHWYDEKTGNIYFHGAKEGHKIDCLKQCDKEMVEATADFLVEYMKEFQKM